MNIWKKFYNAGNTPSIYEEKYRKINYLCLYTKIIDGEWDFCCNNKVDNDLFICRKHIKGLSNKYNINFEIEIKNLLSKKPFDEDECFRSEFIQSIKENLHVNIEENIFSYISIFLNPEIRWMYDRNFFIGLPKYWFDNLTYYSSTTKSSKEQGKENGPDFIFKDKTNNKLIGFEIVSYKWNITNQFKKDEQAINFFKDSIYNVNSIDSYIEEIIKIIKSKNEKSKKYFKCDELYLGIVVNNTIMDYHYYLFEIILNKYIKDNNLNFQNLFIL